MRQETKTSSEFEPSSEVPVRKRSGARLILGIVSLFLILVGIAWLLANLHWVPKVGEPLVDVRSEVTGVEDPRTQDGDVDYLGAINQHFSRGVNPSDNAMVHYFSVNRQAIDSQFLDEVFEEMGIVAPNADAPSYTQFGEDFDFDLADWQSITTQPWNAEQFPRVFVWFKEQQQFLPEIYKAAKLPSCYFPLVSNQEFARVISAPQGTIVLNGIFDLLNVSAMFHLGNDDVQACLNDLQAIDALARHCEQLPFLNAEFLAAKIDLQKFQLIITTITSGHCTTEQLQALRQLTKPRASSTALSQRMDRECRYESLDCLLAIGRTGAPSEQIFNSDKELPIGARVVPIEVIDWKAAMIRINQWFDLLAACTSAEDTAERQRFEDMFRLEISKIEQDIPRDGTTGFWNRDEAHANQIADELIGLLTPSVLSARGSEQRQQSYRHMCDFHICLALYRQDTGKYPNSLSALIPDYLAAIPKDPLSKKSFQFRLTGDSYQLYSIGINQIDDAGIGVADRDPSDFQSDDESLNFKKLR